MDIWIQKGSKQKWSLTWQKDRVKIKNERRMVDCIHFIIRIHVWTIHLYIWEFMISAGGKW